ncbi:hypothetical protein BCR36DRAFT_223700, partial [Piromyces finnis]
MKTGSLFLTLLGLITASSSTTVNTITKSGSTKTVPYRTVCSTSQKLVSVTTSITPSKTNALDIPVYTVVPKAYEYCTKFLENCKGGPVTIYDSVKGVPIYTQIECPDLGFSKDDVIATASPNQKSAFDPKELYDLDQIKLTLKENTEYIIHDKTLYCYKKSYTMKPSGFFRNGCSTTFSPVEISTKIVPSVSTTSTKVIPTTITS